MWAPPTPARALPALDPANDPRSFERSAAAGVRERFAVMNVSITGEVASRLRHILVEEHYDAVIRIRERRVADSATGRTILWLSVDERAEDDLEDEVEYLPFVIARDLVEQYGNAFSVSLDERRNFAVRVMRRPGRSLNKRRAM